MHYALPYAMTSEIWAMLVSIPGVLSVIVILIFDPCLGPKKYGSGEVVVPVLIPDGNTTVSSIEIVNLYLCVLPSAQAISTLQIELCVSTLTVRYGFCILVDHHFVLRLLSIAAIGGNDGWFPLELASVK